MKRYLVILAGLTFFLGACGSHQAEFRSQWPADTVRPWAGPDYWTNPLEDWQVRDSRLECIAAGGDRNVYLLTRDLSAAEGSLKMSVRLGRLEEDTQPLEEGFVGFRVGIRGAFHDYRDSAVRGVGLNAGIASDGRLFIGTLDDSAPKIEGDLRDVELQLEAVPAGSAYRITLRARSADGKQKAEVVRENVPPGWLTGGLALVCSSGEVRPTPPKEAETEIIELNPQEDFHRKNVTEFIPHALKKDVKLAELPISEKIKHVVAQNPLLGVMGIRRVLRHENFGKTKIGYFRLRRILRELDLNTKEKRYRYYRSC